MKKLFAIAALTVISTATMAFFGLKPSEQKERNLYPILENNLYGYIDKTGKVIIKPQ